MFKPVTSRLDTQIEATKKLNNKGLKELDPLPEFPIDEDEDEDEMPNYPPPPPINETQTEDEDEYEMPNFEPPPPIDEDETEDEGEMSDFEPSTTRKRKEWTPSSFKKADQKKLDNERKYLAEERRRVNVLLGKLSKSGENFIKSGKAVVIERFNRTLKNKMYKQFTIQGNTQYLEMLPKIVKEYNNTKHSSIKMTPIEASKKKNEGTVYFNLYGDMEPLSAKPKFKVGDKVRISKYKRIVFDKGYTPNWSEEMFVITKIQHTNPITYKLKDLRDEEIQGSFYEPELLKAKQDVFRIDKVIRRDYKKKQALIKWKGYNNDFNSWIPFKDLQQI
ncbi:hypothetical protein ACROYT_G004305 [Oculina patagonica]